MINRKIRGLSTRVKNKCSDGLQAVEYQLEYLKGHPKTPLLVPDLSYEQHVEGWELGIEKYRDNIEHNIETFD